MKQKQSRSTIFEERKCLANLF